MTDSFTRCQCPSCNKSLRVPENLLGKSVRCPGCQNKFNTPPNPSATVSNKPASAAPSKPLPSASALVAPKAASAPVVPASTQDPFDPNWDPFADSLPLHRTAVTTTATTPADDLFANLPEVATSPLQPTSFQLPGTQRLPSPLKRHQR